MTRPIIPRDQVARELAVSPRVLVRYEAWGWSGSVQDGAEVGYEPAQIRRLWTIVSFQRDLGINLAGVEVILQLRDRLLRGSRSGARPRRTAPRSDRHGQLLTTTDSHD